MTVLSKCTVSNHVSSVFLPLEEDKIVSGDSGEVAIEVTHPEWPLSVPRNAKVSMIVYVLVRRT